MKLKTLYRELTNLYSIKISFEFNSDDTNEVAFVVKRKVRSYHVVINSKFKDDIKIVGSLFKHELGHIKYLHLDNVARDMIKLKEYIDKTPDLNKKFNKLSDNIKSKLMSTCYNVIHDFEVNSKLLSKNELKYLEDNELHPSLAKDYNLPDGLPYEEYFYPVMDKLITEYLKYTSSESEFINEIISKVFSMDSNDLNLSSEESSESGESKLVTVIKIINSLINCDNEDEPEYKLPKNTTGTNDLSEIIESKENNSDESDRVNIIKRCIKDPVDWKHYVVKKSRKELLNDYLETVFTYELVHDMKYDSTFGIKKGKTNLIRYDSVPTKVYKKVRCYYIVVDISGSMDDEVVKEVLECIKYMRDRDNIDKRSLIVYCNDEVSKIIDMKGDLYSPRTSGGTDLYKAVNAKYMPNYIDKLVLVTDLGENSGLGNLINAVNAVGKDTYCILYNCSSVSEQKILEICKSRDNYKIF